MKPRADALMVALGAAPSLAEARGLIMAGRVMAVFGGKEAKIDKPGAPLDPHSAFRILGEAKRYVSRSGEKLAGALEHFGVSVKGLVCADFGLSTGGFTDCLLQRGAAKVHGVDVAYGVVDFRLRQDPRLVLYERTNVRTLAPGSLGPHVQFAAVDLSFIGLAQVWAGIVGQLEDGATVIALLKPQFEAEAHETPGGVVQDPAVHARVLQQAKIAAQAHHLALVGHVAASIRGADGNQEFLLHLRYEKK